MSALPELPKDLCYARINPMHGIVIQHIFSEAAVTIPSTEAIGIAIQHLRKEIERFVPEWYKARVDASIIIGDQTIPLQQSPLPESISCTLVCNYSKFKITEDYYTTFEKNFKAAVQAMRQFQYFFQNALIFNNEENFQVAISNPSQEGYIYKPPVSATVTFRPIPSLSVTCSDQKSAFLNRSKAFRLLKMEIVEYLSRGNVISCRRLSLEQEIRNHLKKIDLLLTEMRDE